jgi:hypothetical protein
MTIKLNDTYHAIVYPIDGCRISYHLSIIETETGNYIRTYSPMQDISDLYKTIENIMTELSI